MARAYVPLYFSYAEQLAMLSDDERGRLILQLLEYAQAGTVPKLEPTSATAMLFSCMRGQIDRDAEKYNAKCRQNRDNINSRWDKQNTNVYDGIRTNKNDTKEKEKEKEETFLKRLSHRNIAKVGMMTSCHVVCRVRKEGWKGLSGGGRQWADLRNVPF